MRRLLRRLSLAAAALLLPLASCREWPFEETVRLVFLPDGSARVEVRTAMIDFPEDLPGEERIQPTLDLYARGKDEWLLRMEEWGLRGITHALEATEPAEGKKHWEIRRAGIADDPRGVVPRLFAREPVEVRLDWEGGIWTLEIAPQAEPRALRENRSAYEAEVDLLVERWATFQKSFGAVYALFRQHPERRALLLVGGLEEDLDGFLPAEREAMEAALRDFEALDDVELPLLSTARLAPLDADLEIVLPAFPVATEGFPDAAEKGPEVPAPPAGEKEKKEEPGGPGKEFRIADESIGDAKLRFVIRDRTFNPTIEELESHSRDPDWIEKAPFQSGPLPFRTDLRRQVVEVLSRPGPFRLRWKAPAPKADNARAAPGTPPAPSPPPAP